MTVHLESPPETDYLAHDQRCEYRSQAALACLVCGRSFDFEEGEAAIVLRHVAYGYDFVHGGGCLNSAENRIFPEPGYDCAAFGRDPHRQRIVGARSARGWAAVLPTSPEEILSGRPVRYDALLSWVLVEDANAVPRKEGLVRDADLQDEPGSFEFPEARTGPRSLVEYVPLVRTPMLQVGGGARQ